MIQINHAPKRVAEVQISGTVGSLTNGVDGKPTFGFLNIDTDGLVFDPTQVGPLLKIPPNFNTAQVNFGIDCVVSGDCRILIQFGTTGGSSNYLGGIYKNIALGTQLVVHSLTRHTGLLMGDMQLKVRPTLANLTGGNVIFHAMFFEY